MDAKVSIFLGIPFATPPTGSLRYMPPVASTPWKGVKNAHRFAPVCPQQFPKQMHNRWDENLTTGKKNIFNELFVLVRSIALRIMSEARLRNMHELKKALESQSEDCLYLNVYAPESRWFFTCGSRSGNRIPGAAFNGYLQGVQKLVYHLSKFTH